MLRLQRAAPTRGDRVLGVATIVDQLPPDRAERLAHVHRLLPRELLGEDS